MITTTARIRNLILALGIAFGVTFTAIPAGSAQQPGAAYVTRVPSFEPEEVGDIHPVGLAFSASSQNFYVVEAQNQAVAAAGNSEILSIAPAAQRRDLTTVSDVLENPLNIVFDSANGRLLAFQPSSGHFLALSENPGGRLVSVGAGPQNAARLDVRDPEGLALDETSVALFVLDSAGPQILRLGLGSGARLLSGESSVIDLRSAGLVAPRGIAFDATTGHLHVLDAGNQRLFELTQSGQVVAIRDLAPFRLQNPQAMVFAPSSDQTDDPAQLSLFLADQGSPEAATTAQAPAESNVSVQSTGQIVELSLAEPTLAVAAAVGTFTSSLVKTTDMSLLSPPSPDPSGIAYIPASNRLVVVDGEVEETVNSITYFQGANVWELTLSGGMLRTANISKKSPTVVPMTNEPTGVAWNPNNGHYYVTDDDAKAVFDLNPGADGLIGTSDDSWASFLTSTYNDNDPEGIAYNTANNHLFVADGINAEVYEYTLTGSLVNHFDVKAYGVSDPESVEYNAENGTLFVMSSNSSTPTVIETTITGNLLQTINISAANPIAAAGLAYAPASNGSGAPRFYIVDRGIDNNDNARIVDGKMYEMLAPLPTGPTQTPTQDPNATPTLAPTGGPLYASFASNGTVGGLSFADEDIVRFDGQGWSLFFDGSDVGAGSVDLFAFSALDADSFLMAFSANVTLSGLAVTPQDIVRFDATSLGTNTAGTFSIYFDGPDVGLADTTAEKIDALSVLPDGRILISTTGNPAVTGVASPRDEDVLAFTPTSLGDNTAGTWAMYFDGSDAGLADVSSEDIDALDVVGADIYLSTMGTFSVNGVAGAGEDVFVCTPTSLGDVTGCSYASALYFDGSAWNLGGNSLDALHVGATTPLPMPTPTNTSTPTTPTPTFTPTGTFTPTATFTPTNTPDPNITPTDTPTSQPGGNAMLASFAANGTVGGVSFADEDIVQFDGQSWSLFFDGADVGAGSVDLYGISMVDADTFLMTFSASVSLPAANGATLAVTPQDIVQFDATSLGDTTTGTFSMYLHGIDVGLDTSSETIDGLSRLPDGRILISTTVDSSVPGVAGKDEDILAFTPTSLGMSTSGTWAMYFDGSDVGLSDLTSEDLDAIDVMGSDLYLSTNGDFAATGASGAGEDIFICSPTSLGDVTACNFAPSLFFDGSSWGLAWNSLDGLALGP